LTVALHAANAVSVAKQINAAKQMTITTRFLEVMAEPPVFAVQKMLFEKLNSSRNAHLNHRHE